MPCDFSIEIAKNSGFCFGVTRATQAVENEIEKNIPGQRIYTLGALIHNDVYNARLKARGVSVASVDMLCGLADSATAESPVRVFVRAHGIDIETEKLLMRLSGENPHFTYVDCTCSYVKKIHKIVEENTDVDNLLLVLGSPVHPEVCGFVSRFSGEKLVFSDSEEFEKILSQKSNMIHNAKCTILVAQTTQNLCEWEKTKKLLKKVCTNTIIFDTICSVTEKRQLEAKALAEKSDFMVVIGSRSSSNSVKLYSICKEKCPYTIMIESAGELVEKIPFTHKKVGIAAGASTPRDIIQEVQKTMSEAVENFAELLEESLKTLNTGDIVTGYVTAVNDGELQLDIGAKVTGIIKADQITDDPSAKLSEMFKIGDAVKAFVIRVSDVEGFATLSKKRVDSDACWTKIVEAKNNDTVLEGVVIEIVKSGVIVLVDSTRVFVHESQTDLPKGADLNEMKGKTVSLKITEARDQGKKAKGSIRVVTREVRRAAEKSFWENIEEGKRYTGKVKSLTSFGAFVDLGGVDGMVHVTELSWKRNCKPADVVSVGDTVEVYVKSFDKETKKISLGYKSEETNPWYIFTHNYQVGDIVSVKIVSMMPFGAFAEIVDGVDGLIHNSQISMTRIAKPSDVLEIGQVVDAKITDVDMEKQKVNLSIRAILEEAQAAVEEVAEEVVTDAE